MTNQPAPLLPAAGSAFVASAVAGSEGPPASLVCPPSGIAHPKSAPVAPAALSMSGSTLIVATNAPMLKRTKLTGIARCGVKASPATPLVPAAAPS